MTSKQKIIIIISWFVLVPLFVFLFNEASMRFFPEMSGEIRSLVSFLGAVSLAAFLLNFIFGKLMFFSSQRDDFIEQMPRNANELLVFYLNEWNIYSLNLFGKLGAFSFLARQKIDWLLPFTNFDPEEKSQLLKRVKIANQKLYIIKDDPELRKIFTKNIENLFQEKKIDYAVLLQNKASFEDGFSAERYEILETRDVLAVTLDQIQDFESLKRRKELEKELAFEDKILKEATKKKYNLSLPPFEIQIRPSEFWWWKNALPEEEKTTT